jgi:chromosome segregation ATPase
VASNDHHKTVLENLSKEIEILTNYRRRLVEQINNYEAMNKSIESEIKSWVRREDISHQQVHKVKEQIAEL